MRSASPGSGLNRVLDFCYCAGLSGNQVDRRSELAGGGKRYSAPPCKHAPPKLAITKQTALGRNAVGYFELLPQERGRRTHEIIPQYCCFEADCDVKHSAGAQSRAG